MERTQLEEAKCQLQSAINRIGNRLQGADHYNFDSVRNSKYYLSDEDYATLSEVVENISVGLKYLEELEKAIKQIAAAI